MVVLQRFYRVQHVFTCLQGGDLLAIGSRDRHLNVVDLRKYDCHKPDPCKDMSILCDAKTHKVSTLISGHLVVKSAYKKNIFLFLNQNICCGYSKEPSR